MLHRCQKAMHCPRHYIATASSIISSLASGGGGGGGGKGCA
jgi:uncharacterized membrane protein